MINPRAFTVAIFACTPSVLAAPPASVGVRTTITIPAEASESRGVGLVLFDRSEYPRGLIEPVGFSWDEPNAPYTVAIALDTHNPPPTETEVTEDEEGKPVYPMGWFDEAGNWYDRPQREVSVHVGGTEVHNILCPIEFRTGNPMELETLLRFEVGRALLDVSIGGELVIDDLALLGVQPFEPGAESGSADTVCSIVDWTITTEGTASDQTSAHPHRITLLDERFVHQGDRTPKFATDFSAVPDSVERVVATLTLAEPEVGYDHWDKKGVIRIWPGMDDAGNGSGEPIELLRFITPFRKGWTWHADVTHLLPLLRDQRQLQADIGTYMKGWLLSLDLDFYVGEPALEHLSIVRLWDGDIEIGNPDNPTSAALEDQVVPVPDGATRATVYVTATGHGMSPNTNNAGEFMPLGRTLTIDTGAGFTALDDLLWNEDVYLNPCRPQRGTWKFDRAGWAPGSLVLPWAVDAPPFKAGTGVTVGYALDEYLNEGRGQTWAPHHWTHAYIVFSGPRETPESN